ncbi:MAG: hypothetical protein OXG25_10095 [Gammaproteobacteria bacterium]|nr:hypothetical protein [Gammaproteobacteria bacterium]
MGDRSDEFADTCVYFREHDLSTTGNGDYGTRNGIIEIGTEEFLVAQGPPSPVSLTLDHINDQGSSELHKPFYRDALKFHESSVGGGYSVFSMRQSHSDSANSPIREWVFGRLVHQLPASMRLLVHVDDQMSHCLASWICEALAEDIAIVSMSDLDSISDESLAGGAIAVVAYDDPGLERLRRVNVLLRDLGAVHRHYVVGYSFPETDHEYRRVKNDLRVVSSKRKFGWSEYFVLPVGNATLHESLITGINALNDNVVETLRTELGDPLADRLLLKSRQCSNQMNELFLPNTSGLPLRLRPGSVLFPPKTSTDKITQTSVYAMVSAMVQAAREPSNRKLRNDESRLLKFDDNPFVRTVLDPSMFTRYNDGILQASLLRATQRSELDYSASDDLSRQFSTECESILLDHANGAGDAALEFIFALNTRKISLRPADDDKLNDRIKSTRVLDAFQRLLKRETGT